MDAPQPEISPEGPATPRPRRVAAFTLLVAGAAGFLVSLAIDDFWKVYLYLVDLLLYGEAPTGDDAFATASIFMLPAILLSAPALFIWLERSRLLTWLLRVCAFFVAGVLWYFLITESGPDHLLLLLSGSATLNSVGLCLIGHPKRAESPSD